MAVSVGMNVRLKGTTYVVDTACSSALVALDNAALAIRRGRSAAAVTAAANVMAYHCKISKQKIMNGDGGQRRENSRGECD